MIQLTKEYKITLLRWLKQGYIGKIELQRIQAPKENKPTYAEREAELDRLFYNSDLIHIFCDRCRRLNACYLNGNDNTRHEADRVLKEHREEIERSAKGGAK